MNFEVSKIKELSGPKASIYSVVLDDYKQTLFDQFVQENVASNKDEVEEILARLEEMGKRLGAREQFFKSGEAGLGDLVCALYDLPGKKLRVYCIRYGSGLIILGGGGPKTTQKLQYDAKLLEEQQNIKYIADAIYARMRDKEIRFTSDHLDLEGNLKFEDENE